MDFEAPDFDFELLGLEHDLHATLAEAGFARFSDYDQIEVDMGNATLTVHLSCDVESIRPALIAWARENRFERAYWAEDRSKYYLYRRPKKGKQ